MRTLDGHINRVLEGKTIQNICKDGHFLVIHCTNGEEWRIQWATENGIGIEGEPCLARVDVKLVVAGVDAFGAANI